MSNKRYRRPAPSERKVPVVPLFVAQELAVLDELIEMYGKQIKLHRLELQYRLDAAASGDFAQLRWQVSPAAADRAARQREKLMTRRAELLAPPAEGPEVEHLKAAEAAQQADGAREFRPQVVPGGNGKPTPLNSVPLPTG